MTGRAHGEGSGRPENKPESGGPQAGTAGVGAERPGARAGRLFPFTGGAAASPFASQEGLNG